MTLGSIAGRGLLIAAAILAHTPANSAEFVTDEDPKELSARMLAPKGLYPGATFLVRRSTNANHTCSAVLIAPQWAITQAYCVAPNFAEGTPPGTTNPPSEYSLGYGSTTFSGATLVGVEKFVLSGRPPDAGDGIEHGLALVKLASPVHLTPTEIAKVPAAGEAASEAATGGAVVVGWGSFFLEEPREALFNQRHLSVRIMPRAECVAIYGDNIVKSAFCAKSAFKSIDACSGFGGAPLLVPSATGKFIVQGLVSWGSGDCTKSGKPHVYTDLADYRDWIAATVGPLPETSAPAAAKRSIAPDAEPAVDSSSEEFRTRVVGPTSNLAPTGLFRYMVSLGKARQNQALGHFCGGSLITPTWVLTAAHCVENLQATPTALQLKIDSDLLSRGGVLLHAKRIVMHDAYVPARPGEPPQNDIALIEIEGTVPSDIVPLPIMDAPAEAELLGAREDATVIGWGKNAFSAFGKTSDHLHWTTVKLVKNAACNDSVRYAGHINDRQLCAGNDFADSCQGDSGGPLLTIDDSQEFVLVGIVSWGEGCAKPEKPGVYVRLSSYVDWIEATIQSPPAPPPR